ncbi:protein GOLM2 isoform X2 [Lampris incognitus]|uniref:protein GOLM2 isoform X2 n=1 Tax=Lampris incognitus TaxID=2546036 RepID=UPI0024B5E884|nr:protein GOLM2 isoform X2 [Lampris incognitus]
MVGFGANRRGGRLPSFILVASMVIIAILSFNYWTVSAKHGRLLDELAEARTQVKRTDAARSRLEKRNSELMVQVDTHRKQIDQRDGDYAVLEGKLQAREALVKKCADDKMKLQGDVTAQMTEIQKLKEQLKELKQEFMKQEDQMREVKKNSTTLERRLEYESLQCGRQIAQLKDEYEETKKTLEEEASKLRKTILDSRKTGGAGGHVEGATGVDLAGERHTLATRQHDSRDLKDEMGKLGSDAGMPGIEDSEVGKMDDVQFALKKPAITQKHNELPDIAGAGAGPGAGEGAGGRALSLDQPRLQQDRVVEMFEEGRAAVVPPPGLHLQPLPLAVADKPVLFAEDNKAGIRADEFGEQQRQIGAPDNVKADGPQMKGLQLPPNPAQVPNPIEPHIKDQVPAAPPHHRQNDEDRDMQGDRAVDYEKQHQPIDIL